MLKDLFTYVVHEASYWQIYVAVVVYFLVLYFIGGGFFQQVCRFLERRKVIRRIVNFHLERKQMNYEIRHSLLSIAVFGFSGIPIIYFVRHQYIELLPDTIWNLFTGLCILTVWNEIHFFTIHRLLHYPIFMKNFHYIHHRSKVPSVWAVYSFHPIEAALLSTVSLTIAPFISFSALAFILFPVVSLFLNLAGHANYRFGDGVRPYLALFATRHNEHHNKGRNHYGFLTPFMDLLFSKQIRKK